MELFKIYNDFLKLREELINYAIDKAVYVEDRGAEKVRPIAKLSNETELQHVSKLIAQWESTVKTLCKGDPVRYNPTSRIFSPIPKILYDRVDLFINETTAVSTRKIARTRILQRLHKDWMTEKNINGARSKLARNLRNEMRKFENDPEEFYRIRSLGYKDVILQHRNHREGELDKIRAPFNGTFFYDPTGKCRVHLPEHQKRSFERVDNISSMGLKPVRTSLNIKGVLLRQSDIDKAKSQVKRKRDL